MRPTLLMLAVLLGPVLVLLGPEPATVAQSCPDSAAGVSEDPNDWPMYNRDVTGTRSSPGEKAIGKDNVAQLVQKWRFPLAESKEKIGVVHATVVVGGYVYFGTLAPPTFYKLAPDGTVKWAYQNPDHAAKKPAAGPGLPTAGFMNAGLVLKDTVYACDLGGIIYALDRATGKERWKIDTRAAPCPGAHSSNCIFAAPILADDKLVVAGGGFEHGVAADPRHACCTGRGFVMALTPRTGKVLWKYDVGPEPKKLDPPVKIKDAWGEHVFQFGPSTSSVWCTPSYDAGSQTIFFGTDTHNAPRQPTKDDPKLYTKHSCAMIAVDARTGAERWITQINPGDVWNYAMCGYDATTGLYKDQSIGDTPKIYWLLVNGVWRRVIGFGCKNGGFYILDAATGEVLFHTPVYTGPPVHPPPTAPQLDPRTLALPGGMGGLQTGCATDGKAIYTNGTDMLRLGTSADPRERFLPPTSGRVVSVSLDTQKELWRHERPKVKAVGGTKEKPAFTDVGDPVASGIAVANGVVYFTTTVSNQLVALDAATGKVLKEIDLGPVWCGPTVSRGRVYVGTGNLLFAPGVPQEAYFPKSATGAVYSFGLPGDDEVSRMKGGDE
jgi:polyvinyl alcohol dehydrogenase (cytochrome)